MMKFSLQIAVIIGLTLLWQTACSVSDSSTIGQDIELTIDGNDQLRFEPDRLMVPAGSTISLTFRNVGLLEHNFALVKEDVDLFTIDESAVLQDINSGNLEGGESFRLSFPAPEPGQYRYVCLIAGHAASGMIGTLEVAPDSSQ